jgi:hypothetical protein
LEHNTKNAITKTSTTLVKQKALFPIIGVIGNAKRRTVTMKKMMFSIIMVSVFVLFLGLTLCQAQSSKPWVVGKWRGFENWTKNSWMLEIVEKQDGKLSGSFMWISEKSKMYPISINLDSNNTLIFQNASKEEFVLKRSSDRRMDGKYMDKNGKERKIKFWKDEGASTSPFLGYREGTWVENNLETSLEVLFMDETAISGIYKATQDAKVSWWGYVNGELTSAGKYLVQQLDPAYQFTFFFKKGGEIVDASVIYNGGTTNNATFTKKQKPAEIPIPEPAPTIPKQEPVALSDIPISECQWLVGSWIGVIEKEKETRSLEITLAKEGMKAKYGVTGKGMGYTKLEISGGNIFFETGSKSKVNLHKVSNSQMEGTFETSEGRITKVTFIRNDTSTSQNLPESISAFLGTWEGFWGGQLGSKLVVEKIDLKEAKAIYSWEDGPDGAFKGGQGRVTAKVDEKKATIEWGSTTKFIFTMGKDLKSIEGRREAPGDISTITMKRKK